MSSEDGGSPRFSHPRIHRIQVTAVCWSDQSVCEFFDPVILNALRSLEWTYSAERTPLEIPLWEREERALRRLDVLFPRLFASLNLWAKFFLQQQKQQKSYLFFSNAAQSARPAEPNFTVLSGDFAETNSNQSRTPVLAESGKKQTNK